MQTQLAEATTNLCRVLCKARWKLPCLDMFHHERTFCACHVFLYPCADRLSSACLGSDTLFVFRAPPIGLNVSIPEHTRGSAHPSPRPHFRALQHMAVTSSHPAAWTVLARVPERGRIGARAGIQSIRVCSQNLNAIHRILAHAQVQLLLGTWRLICRCDTNRFREVKLAGV